jgi:hypothetical protein
MGALSYCGNTNIQGIYKNVCNQELSCDDRRCEHGQEDFWSRPVKPVKGKSTRCKSTPVEEEDVIEIPEELIANNCKIDLCIDIMYVNKCRFMMTIDRMIRFQSAIPIEKCTHKEYYLVLDMVLQLYNSAGFHIKTIHCNREFCVMMERVKDN